jgi:hydrogenase-4 component B
MTYLLFGWIVILGGGIGALAAGRQRRLASGLAVAAVWVGSLAAAVPVAATLAGRPPAALSWAWSVPTGGLAIGLDGLSAFFCLPVLILAPLAALYGRAYLTHDTRRPGSVWFFYNLLVVSLAVVLAARDGILFLVAWEVMAMASFVLVVHDHQRPAVRAAGWTYLVATHLGTAALLVFFALLGNRAGSLDFASIAAAGRPSAGAAGILFALALTGFGAKAGLLPLHVWLPEAHPAAPSHVSALMSGVMINSGIYGLLRAVTFNGPPPAAWGWTLVGLGLASGIAGVVLALAQSDLKRLLAYSSVENMGVVCLGLGAGLLGLSWHVPLLAALGLAGGLLHLLNHALFKGLLFLGAGAVLHSTGTRDMNRLGGLIKTMPWTAAAFFAGAAAISALPPFNGFVGELLIYFAGLQGALPASRQGIVLAAVLLGGLALIGGLAVACFTKCFGLVFLGLPRDLPSREAPWAMRLPMLTLAALCLGLGMAAPLMPRLLAPAVEALAGPSVAGSLAAAEGLLGRIAGVGLVLVILTAALALGRRRAYGGRRSPEGTWDCGYARPTARMQYTATSYTQPLAELFGAGLGQRRRGRPVAGHFPPAAALSTHTPDAAREWLFAPLFQGISRLLAPLRVLQHGRIHLYILYLAVTLVLLLIWKGGA